MCIKASDYLKTLRHKHLSVRLATAQLAGRSELHGPEEIPILAEALYWEWSTLNGIEAGVLPDSDARHSILLIQELCKAITRIIRMGWDISPVLVVIDMVVSLESLPAQAAGQWVLSNVYRYYKLKEKAA